jgi:hypothetical protein
MSLVEVIGLLDAHPIPPFTYAGHRLPSVVGTTGLESTWFKRVRAWAQEQGITVSVHELHPEAAS